MRATFHIFYNGESCKDVGLSVISRPTIPVPEREYDTIKVEGRDGELHRDKKTYKDIEIALARASAVTVCNLFCAGGSPHTR